MQDATVVWFNDKKGFGYLKDDNETLIFVHYSTIDVPQKHKTLTAGQSVKFSAQDELGQLKATLVIPRNVRNAKR